MAADMTGEIKRMPSDVHKEHEGRTIHMGKFDLPGVYLPIRYNDCTCNQKVSVANRVLKAVPQMTRSGKRMLTKILPVMKRSTQLTEMETDEDFCNRYSGMKRRRYESACAELNAHGLHAKDCYCTMFVKCENINPTAKFRPEPRAIQFRAPKFNVAISRYLKPIEEHIYRMALHGKYFTGLPVVAKGMNTYQRASMIQQKMSQFANPRVISLDGKRFDLHVNKDLLKFEHKFYAMFNNDPEFLDLLRKQLANTVVSRRGFRYKTSGGRMSGDMNTGLGNCVITVMMIAAYTQSTLKCKVDLLVDGDDFLIFIDESNLSKFMSTFEEAFLSFGMEMEFAGVASTMEEIEWCQTRPVQVQAGRWRMIRDPIRVLSHVLVGKKWQVSRQKSLMSAIALCEQALAQGVPVLQNMARALWRNGGESIQHLYELEKKDPIFWRASMELSWDTMLRKGFEFVEPSLEARESFAKAFGISVQQQRDWEHYLDTWVCNFGVPVKVAHIFDGETWKYEEFPTGINYVDTKEANKTKTTETSTAQDQNKGEGAHG